MAKTPPDDSTTSRNDTETTPPPGRPVVLEAAPSGLWMTVTGAAIALLAPLFGFLIGTAIGRDGGGVGLSALYLGLFLGVIIGGCGVLAAVAGGRRLYQATRQPPSS